MALGMDRRADLPSRMACGFWMERSERKRSAITANQTSCDQFSERSVSPLKDCKVGGSTISSSGSGGSNKENRTRYLCTTPRCWSHEWEAHELPASEVFSGPTVVARTGGASST
mmetsp:Transcript_89475/g.172173  ORF Transcript_89475/g.172173 Transcript_89475/m.172173 type:complete len:114 (+) Transcript_89475:77-418(+)